MCIWLITNSRSRFPVILYYGTQTIPQHPASAAILLQSNFLKLEHCKGRCPGFQGHILNSSRKNILGIFIFVITICIN